MGLPPSIFNDVLGPVMRGPSSSHCAAALRLGRLARDLLGGEFTGVLVQFDRAGSLPTTHESQGSDMGLCGGLLGWEADDERLPNAVRCLREAGVELRFEVGEFGDPHPNTYRLTLWSDSERRSLVGISTGGGMIEVLELDGERVSLCGDREVLLADGRRLRPVLPVTTPDDLRLPFTSLAELLAYDDSRGLDLWRLAVAYECARGGLSREEVLARAADLGGLLQRSVAAGLAGTHYEDRLLGAQSPGYQQALAAGRLLDAGALNRAILYVSALMEVKSSLGVIVAMPTAGACAALPGVVLALAEERGQGLEAVARAFLAAGLVGLLITSAWTFAAEVGGCQAEGGSAAAMAAAALVTLADGSQAQALAAASLALQSMLGLICDPIANRVEAPCLGKNLLAAGNALTCANLALAGFDPVLPLDEVIDAARRVGEQMPRELRCTALGGLSTTPTSLALEARLARRCGGCGGEAPRDR